MTATLSPLPAPRRPARSGEPWTEDDYVTLVRLCTEGADLATVAEALERRDTAVLNRTRRMLPLDERGLPADRALTQLRLHLEQEPGYDWAARLTESPPPRPVQHTTYTVQRNGIPGLQDEELLDVAELVVTGASTRSGTQRQVLRAVLERRLEHCLAERVGRRLVDRTLSAGGLGDPAGAVPYDEPYDPHESYGGPWDAG